MSLSNILYHGFHPAAERTIGNPHIPRTYDNHPLPFNKFWDDLVDDQPYASYVRADLCLLYIYEVETQYRLGDEIVTLPIVHRVYRRDPNLCWSDISTALARNRFPPRYQSIHPAVAPMNRATFQKFVRRFYLANDDEGHQVLFEKSTRRPVQRQHEDLEQILIMMLPINLGDDVVFKLSTEGLAQAALEHRQMWHLDRFIRAGIEWRRLHG